MRESEVREYVFAFQLMRLNLQGWIRELEAIHDQKKAEEVHVDDYQNGYLHGMTTAIEHLKPYVKDIEERTEWIKSFGESNSSNP